MSSSKKTLPERLYRNSIANDLAKKMVFIGGPRQVGKTTLAQSFLKPFHPGHHGYLNWDNEVDRRTIQKSAWDKEEPLIIFDEVHKKKGWQSFIKGAYDTWKNAQKYIVTGSARLDLYRKGGDSLMGRYHYYRIHPFSLPELGFKKGDLEALFKFGGFPESLIEQDETQHRRWLNQRISKLVRIDIRDLENISNLDKLELLAEVIPQRIGSPLSYKSLSEDLDTTDKTVKKWIQLLESLYFCYLIAPYGAPQIKAIKKSQKIYLWDWSQIDEPGARFENMVASHLLKLCHYWTDVHGFKAELRYIRDESGRECDFVVIKNKKALFAVECKLSDSNLAPNISYFQAKLKIPKWYQVTLTGTKKVISPELKILPFEEFCRAENLV